MPHGGRGPVAASGVLAQSVAATAIVQRRRSQNVSIPRAIDRGCRRHLEEFLGAGRVAACAAGRIGPARCCVRESFRSWLRTRCAPPTNRDSGGSQVQRTTDAPSAGRPPMGRPGLGVQPSVVVVLVIGLVVVILIVALVAAIVVLVDFALVATLVTFDQWV